MLIESLILGIIVALIRKGKINNLGLIQLERISFLFFALILQLIIDFFGRITLGQLGSIVHFTSYLLLFYFYWFNRNRLNILIPIGLALNFLVISFNNFSMPVHTSYMPKDVILKLSNSVTHSIMTSNTKLSWLGDIFYISWPVKQMLSVGDIFLDLGIFFLIQKIMVKN
ncbi:MAG: hypothetical protein PWQ67_2010 [Clostridia bacterium]|jgi:hypothetical protein|nr:hypothetical protein [Clostridia bacterium]MDN5323556.1 hypothetical protein [Clostridia bacterium]